MVNPFQSCKFRVDTALLQLPGQDIENGLQVEIGVAAFRNLTRIVDRDRNRVFGVRLFVGLTRPDQLHQVGVHEVGKLSDALTNKKKQLLRLKPKNSILNNNG